MIIRRLLLPRLRAAGAVVTAVSVLLPTLPLEARTRKGDRQMREAAAAENRQDWDRALILSGEAFRSDPADPGYQLQFRRIRFGAANFHLAQAQALRSKGQLAPALAEYQKAFEIDPSSDIAEQEIRRTKQMMDREEKRKAADPNTAADPDAIAMTPAEVAKRQVQERVESLMPVPELRPLNQQPIVLRMNNQKPKVLFDTLGKLAGVNILFDPDYEQGAAKNQTIDLNGSTLEEALDYLSVVTHSFWKPLSANTIFVSQENPTKRREYDDQVVKVFYLSNITSPQELQEVITTLRQVIEVNKLFQYSAQNAVIVKADPARMALAEKIIADLDKPRGEVIVDVMVMEVNSTRSRQLAAAFAPNGISTNIVFNPRSAITTTTGSSSNSGFNNNSTSDSSTSTSTSTSTTASSVLPLSNFKRISTSDFALTNVPGGLLEAIASDADTRVLQRPQIRAVDNQKAILKIGEKIPTASGSYSSGVGTVAVSALVNTQFTYIDTGVNLEMTPHVHDNGEVSLHLDIDISQVDSYNDLGGISEPVIGQHKATVDVRMRDGQINMLGGLVQVTDSKTVSGIPGLGNIPILRRLFTSESLSQSKNELLIALVPHVVRGPDVTPENLASVFAGNQTNYSVRHAPRSSAASAGEAAMAPVTPATGSAAPMGPSPAMTVPAPASMAPLGPTPFGSTSIGPAPRLSFAPSQLDAQVGSSFTVSVRADGVTNLQALESQFKFDPKVLRINSIVAGDLLQQNGVALIPQRNIMNDVGDASASLARDPGKGGVNGSGALLTITFQAVGKGQTFVSMPKASLHQVGGVSYNGGSSPLSVTVK